MRNRLNQESHIRTCQEIQELRTCCEETDRARQAGIDELSVPQKEGFSNCESTIDSKSGFTEQGEFIVSWEFQDETASSSGASHVPSQPPFRVPEECPAAILDCRMIHRMSWALQETFLKAYLFEKDHPQLSKIQGIWYLLASTPGPRFQREAGILRHTGGTYSHNGMMDFSSRKCILENSQTLWNFKAGKSTSRLKYAQKNSRSEANRFFRLRYAWWNDASALKKLLDKHVQFRRRISVEEQHAQKYDRFSWGMQIASMIYEHFRSAWACEAVQGLSDFINKRLENDDFQDFDVRWDQAPLSVSETPSYVILEGLYKSNCRILFSFRLFWLCVNKRMFETMGNRVIQDWRHLLDFILFKRCGVSPMIQHLATDARLIQQKDNRPLPHQLRRPRLRERYPQKVLATEKKAVRQKWQTLVPI